MNHKNFFVATLLIILALNIFLGIIALAPVKAAVQIEHQGYLGLTTPSNSFVTDVAMSNGSMPYLLSFAQLVTTQAGSLVNGSIYLKYATVQHTYTLRFLLYTYQTYNNGTPNYLYDTLVAATQVVTFTPTTSYVWYNASFDGTYNLVVGTSYAIAAWTNCTDNNLVVRESQFSGQAPYAGPKYTPLTYTDTNPQYIAEHQGGFFIQYDTAIYFTYIYQVPFVSGWNYRVSYTINAVSGAGTNYDVPIIVYYGSGINTNDNVYTSGNSKIDFSDIRFTTSNGQTLLSYWKDPQASIDGNYATFWVKVTADLNSNQQIYVYWGNSGASDIGNPYNTFLKFDNYSYPIANLNGTALADSKVNGVYAGYDTLTSNQMSRLTSNFNTTLATNYTGRLYLQSQRTGSLNYYEAGNAQINYTVTQNVAVDFYANPILSYSGTQFDYWTIYNYVVLHYTDGTDVMLRLNSFYNPGYEWRYNDYVTSATTGVTVDPANTTELSQTNSTWIQESFKTTTYHTGTPQYVYVGSAAGYDNYYGTYETPQLLVQNFRIRPFAGADAVTGTWGTEENTIPPPPTPSPSPTPQPILPTPPQNINFGLIHRDYYFRSDVYSQNNVTAYRLDTDFTNTPTRIIDNITDITPTPIVNYGFRVWLVNNFGVTTEMTSGSPVGILSVSNTSDTIVSNVWLSPDEIINLGTTILKVTMYSQINFGDWSARQTWISPKLMTTEITSSTWTFSGYLDYANSTYTAFSYDSNLFKSGISGIIMAQPTQDDLQTYRILSGDFVQFILQTYLPVMGPAFYLLVLLIPTTSLYLRHKGTGPILMFFALFGMPGGVIWLFVPGIAATVVDIFLVLIGAFLVWKVIR